MALIISQFLLLEFLFQPLEDQEIYRTRNFKYLGKKDLFSILNYKYENIQKQSLEIHNDLRKYQGNVDKQTEVDS